MTIKKYENIDEHINENISVNVSVTISVNISVIISVNIFFLPKMYRSLLSQTDFLNF